MGRSAAWTRLSGTAALLGGTAAALVCASAPVLAHQHPSGITDLVTPAVVRVEAESRVEITLLDHVGELLHVERSYDVPIGVGTGFVVNPEGTIVVPTEVVKTDKKVEIYAANRIFAEHHKVPIPDDYEKHRVENNDVLDHHLQACYDTESKTSTCIIDVTTEITVFPNIQPADSKGFKAEIVHTGDRPEAPAVIRPVQQNGGGTGLPTAPLAPKVPDKESPIAVAGFVGRPAADLQHTIDIGHLAAGGAGESGRPFKDPEGKVDEPAKLGALVDKGLLGAPVIGDKDGAVVGYLVGGGKEARMIGVREVQAALGQAKLPPRRGPIDSAFEVALTRFHSKYYGDAVPAFQRVLELYPGHIVAAKHLKTAQEKRGGPEDANAKLAAAPASDEGVPLWPFLAGAGVLVLIVLVGAVVLWRRRGSGDGDEGGGPAPEQPVPQPVAAQAVYQAPVAPAASSVSSAPPAGAARPAGVPIDSLAAAPRPPRDDTADPTVVVGRPRSYPPVPQVGPQGEPILVAGQPAPSGTGPQPVVSGTGAHPVVTGTGAQPVMAASDGDSSPGLSGVVVPAVVGRQQGAKGKSVQKYCTQCGMGLGPAHRFCGYCGHPAET